MTFKHLLALLALPVLGALNACENSGDPTGPSFSGDSTARDVDWHSTAVAYRGQNGLNVTYACPDSGTVHTVWGSDVYTDDSSVCTAAVHAGKITLAAGGTVVIEIRKGQSAYDSSTRHGVTTWSYDAWHGSYVFK